MSTDVVRIYLPPDTNTLLSVAGQDPSPDWLSPEEAVLHCERGLGIWDWAGTDTPHQDHRDVILA